MRFIETTSTVTVTIFLVLICVVESRDTAIPPLARLDTTWRTAAPDRLDVSQKHSRPQTLRRGALAFDKFCVADC